MFKNKKIKFFSIWTIILAVTLYFTCIYSEFSGAYLLFFVLCIIAGIAADYIICDWIHFATPVKKNIQTESENGPGNSVDDFYVNTKNSQHSFFDKLVLKYECHDTNWKNLWLFLLLLLHGLAVFIIVSIFSKFGVKNRWIDNSIMLSFSALLIPYFFHKAYYFAVRIPTLKKGVYVFFKDPDRGNNLKNQLDVAQSKDLLEGEKVRVNLFGESNKSGVKSLELDILAIRKNWSYKDLWNFIFFMNQNKIENPFYRSQWPELPEYEYYDRLVKNCWEMTIEKGMESKKGFEPRVTIKDYELKEFYKDSVEIFVDMTFSKLI